MTNEMKTNIIKVNAVVGSDLANPVHKIADNL